MTEHGPSWGDMANKTWGELAGEPAQEQSDTEDTVARGPRLLDFMVDPHNHSRADHAMQSPQPIEIDIEQKLLALIAELETLKARVAELEARISIPDDVKARTFGRA